MGQEFELKYRASAQQNAAIMADYQGFREISMETTYYDTPEGSLSERRWTLRHRLEDGVSVCTLKTPGENGARNEWETECDSIEAAIPALCKLGAPPELEALVSGGVSPVCGARFFRQAVLLELEACTVELALDRGFLRSGIRMELLGEVEVDHEVLNVSVAGKYVAVLYSDELMIYDKQLQPCARLTEVSAAKLVLMRQDGSAVLVGSGSASLYLP